MLSLLLCLNSSPIAQRPTLPSLLRVSPSQRRLVTADNKPFFYLGDTAWELFHRLSYEEADHYLTTRARQGFTVIQAVVLAEFDGLTEPNANGDLPLINNDPTKPNEAYFKHVDRVVRRANQLGLTVGLLPTWGDKVSKQWGVGPEIFNRANAALYGEFLARRYKNDRIIWILGGDREVKDEKQEDIWWGMATGIRGEVGERHLFTYHPQGERSSSEWFHEGTWLDFNMLQSGHGKVLSRTVEMISKDYAKLPPKPVIDGEPNYEDHAINWDPKNGWFDAWDVRKTLYWSLFSGACGYTYGCHDIWQFLSPKRPPVTHARTPWQRALHLPGATQVRIARSLIESLGNVDLVPDAGLVSSDRGQGASLIVSAKTATGSAALVYVPNGRSFTLSSTVVRSADFTAQWLNPRTGGFTPAVAGSTAEWAPPLQGAEMDWVLVLRKK